MRIDERVGTTDRGEGLAGRRRRTALPREVLGIMHDVARELAQHAFRQARSLSRTAATDAHAGPVGKHKSDFLPTTIIRPERFQGLAVTVRAKDGTMVRVVNPVLPAAALLLMAVPLRSREILRLVRGESDVRMTQVRPEPLTGSAGSVVVARRMVNRINRMAGSDGDQLHLALEGVRLWRQRFDPLGYPDQAEEGVDPSLADPSSGEAAWAHLFRHERDGDPVGRLKPPTPRGLLGFIKDLLAEALARREACSDARKPAARTPETEAAIALRDIRVGMAVNMLRKQNGHVIAALIANEHKPSIAHYVVGLKDRE